MIEKKGKKKGFDGAENRINGEGQKKGFQLAESLFENGPTLTLRPGKGGVVFKIRKIPNSQQKRDCFVGQKKANYRGERRGTPYGGGPRRLGGQPLRRIVRATE